MDYLLIALAVLLGALYTGMLLRYRRLWILADLQENIRTDFKPSVFFTIVIPARNESENIEKCLRSILAQDYPADLFEIIVIDDHSEDDTATRVESLNSSQIRLIKLKEHVSGYFINSHKKKAIETAIQHSKGSWIVTTDADCMAGPRWLLHVAHAIQNDKPDLIAMPVKMEDDNHLVQMFDSLDFMTLQGITGAGVYGGKINMSNGANLAYSKKMFEKVGGFEGIDYIASGDDMLLMEKISKAKGKIIYLKSENTIVVTGASTGILAFLRQRIRWASKSTAYKDNRLKRMMAFVYFFNLMLLVSGLDAILNNSDLLIYHWKVSKLTIWASLWIIKTIVEFYFLFPVAVFFRKTKLMRWFIFMQPLHVIYIILSGFLGLTGKYQWKGRQVK